MLRNERRPEDVIGKLSEAEVVLAQAGTTVEACRRLPVSEQTYYLLRKKYGGPETVWARRMPPISF